MRVAQVFGAIFAITIVAIVFVTLRARHRANGLARSAAALGLVYDRSAGIDALDRELLELALFGGAGLNRGNIVSNVMTGVLDGVALTVCDYAYWHGSTPGNRTDYAQTVTCLRLDAGRNYPAFAIHPLGNPVEQATRRFAIGAADTLAALPPGSGSGRAAREALGALLEQARQSGVAVAASSEFARAYRVTGPEAARISSVLRAAALDSLLRDPRPLTLECTGRGLAIYSRNHLVTPGALPAFLHRCADVARTLFDRS